jgi:uncharacterized protein YcsI (UPF0317 family)
MSSINESARNPTMDRSGITLVSLTSRASLDDEKALRSALLRAALPACQPQEGSPANTFTESELQELQAAFPEMKLRPRNNVNNANSCDENKKMDICDWQKPSEHSANPSESEATPSPSPQEAPVLDWHGAPRFACKNAYMPREFRKLVRQGKFTGPTNAQCPGFLQCNLVVLPQGPIAFDFLLFCQRNPQSCPLIEVCDVGSACPVGLAPDADLRTDVPKYAIYRNGKLEREVTDATEYWPDNSVAFLIGCSFSYDGALMDAGIPLKSAEQGKNVPMYKSNLKCRGAGSLQGCMVVSMKPIPAMKISRHVEITSSYKHAHGGPVCIGSAAAIGIEDVSKPDWGDSIEVGPDEVAVFHACGVTPQAVLMASKVPFAITHAAGHMFVTDLPSDMANL